MEIWCDRGACALRSRSKRCGRAAAWCERVQLLTTNVVQVWLFFGFITSFIWVPLLIIASSFGIVFCTFLAFVFGVRSRPPPRERVIY